jgi:hypothetical protein
MPSDPILWANLLEKRPEEVDPQEREGALECLCSIQHYVARHTRREDEGTVGRQVQEDNESFQPENRARYCSQRDSTPFGSFDLVPTANLQALCGDTGDVSLQDEHSCRSADRRIHTFENVGHRLGRWPSPDEQLRGDQWEGDGDQPREGSVAAESFVPGSGLV